MTSDLTSHARALAARLEAAAPQLGDTRLVLIDGPAGAGKTTFAESLARHLAARADSPAQRHSQTADAVVQTLHADDMYEGWAGLPHLADVLIDQVIAPLAAGKPGEFRQWDWHRGERTRTIHVPQPPVLIIEGVGVAMAAARAYASLVVWIEAPPEICLQRGLRRDGQRLRSEWLTWQRTEAAEFAREHTRAAADVRLSSA